MIDIYTFEYGDDYYDRPEILYEDVNKLIKLSSSYHIAKITGESVAEDVVMVIKTSKAIADELANSIKYFMLNYEQNKQYLPDIFARLFSYDSNKAMLMWKEILITYKYCLEHHQQPYYDELIPVIFDKLMREADFKYYASNILEKKYWKEIIFKHNSLFKADRSMASLLFYLLQNGKYELADEGVLLIKNNTFNLAEGVSLYSILKKLLVKEYRVNLSREYRAFLNDKGKDHLLEWIDLIDEKSDRHSLFKILM